MLIVIVAFNDGYSSITEFLETNSSRFVPKFHVTNLNLNSLTHIIIQSSISYCNKVKTTIKEPKTHILIHYMIKYIDFYVFSLVLALI